MWFCPQAIYASPHCADGTLQMLLPRSLFSTIGSNAQSTSSPCPSCPYVPWPHVYTLPAADKQALWLPPQTTDVMGVRSSEVIYRRCHLLTLRLEARHSGRPPRPAPAVRAPQLPTRAARPPR